MDQSPEQGIPITLTEPERVVIKEAVRYTLDGGVPSGFAGEDVEAVLEQHLDRVQEDNQIHVRPGMDELYRSIFQDYARALQETVDDEDDGAESMASFFEGAFKGVVKKIKRETDPAF